MMRLLTILICVFFLSGFGWFSSIDCEDSVDSALYNEGVSHLNERERKMRRMIYESKQQDDDAVKRAKDIRRRLGVSLDAPTRKRPYYIEFCEKTKDHERFK